MNLKGLRTLVYAILTLVVVACGADHQKPEKNKVDHKVTEKRLSELSVLNKKIAGDTLNADLFNERAQYYVKKQMVNSALADINRALQLDNTNTDYFLTLSDIYLLLGKADYARATLQKVLKAQPENPMALFRMSKLELVLKNYNGCFYYVGQAIGNRKHFPEAYYLRGLAMLEAGDTAKAILDFQKVNVQDPGNYEACVQLGMLYTMLNNPLAVDYLEKAINIDPDNAEAYYLIGMYFQEQEDYDKSLAAYDRLLKVFPDYPYAYYNKGYIKLVYQEDYQAALVEFSLAIKLNPNYVEAWYNRGYCNELTGKLSLARSDYKRALELNPDYSMAVTGLNRIDNQ